MKSQVLSTVTLVFAASLQVNNRRLALLPGSSETRPVRSSISYITGWLLRGEGQEGADIGTGAGSEEQDR